MSFPRYPKYKPSGVEWLGEVPDGWEIRRLRFLCNIETGGRDTEDAVAEGLTHHALKPRSAGSMTLGGDASLLAPIEDVGSAVVREDPAVYITEIIEKLNDLFQGDLTDQDRLVYVNNVIIGKMLESATLREQAGSNTKEQFATSPDVDAELLSAIMGALDAHTAMSTQALNSDSVRRGLKDILLNHAGLYEKLRGTGALEGFRRT